MRIPLILLLMVPLGAADLWTAETLAAGTIYTDQVARARGDLVTILVKVSTSVSDSAKTETKRQNTANASINMLPGLSETAPTKGTSTIGRLPGLDLGSSKNFSGEGKVEQTGEVRSTITARVIDVLDNGNLVIEGRFRVTVGDNVKTVQLTGIARTADIRADNTILSEKMHNLQVAIEGEGPLSRSQQEGFLGRILDVFWPF